MKFECIKGYATKESIVCMKGDVVKFIESDEEIVFLEGVAGWCKGVELSLSPKTVVEHFQVIGITYTI
jgi:hypothetical protein